jgi:SAM-dependent methyltransferase
MAFSYNTVVPWGRSFEEYQRMFALTDHHLKVRLLGCGDGPASFNAEMFKRGNRVISCDPLYQLTPKQIEDRISATCEDVIRQTRRNQDQFNWSLIKSPEELRNIRMAAMQMFLEDYTNAKASARYVAGELPHLPFKPDSFDIAVCSHLLFLYTDRLSLEFHQRAIEAMCDVAREARIFPLLTYNAEPSPFVEPLQQALAQAGYQVSIETVPYEFQRGGNKMMRVLRPTGSHQYNLFR